MHIKIWIKAALSFSIALNKNINILLHFFEHLVIVESGQVFVANSWRESRRPRERVKRLGPRRGGGAWQGQVRGRERGQEETSRRPGESRGDG